ncbi:MAG: nuclear transport factor 2 family protein [Chthoniobacteraceae bacterium]
MNETIADRADTPADIARAFLAALEARDLPRAQSYLGEGVRIVAPGGRVVGSVAEIVANSARRYRAVGKRFDRFDVVPGVDGRSTVYCIGTLQGTWLDGTAFDGIRFIDRFEIAGGRILRQEVWNDAAEHRARIAQSHPSPSDQGQRP